MKEQLKNSVFQLIGIEKFLLALKTIININSYFFRTLSKGLVYRKENYVNWDPVRPNCVSKRTSY